MKAILLLVLLATAFAEEKFLTQIEEIRALETKYQLSNQQLMDFLTGYALGIGLMNAIPSVYPCLLTVTGFKDQFAQAMEDFKTKDLEHIISGVQIMAHLFDGVAGGCGNTVLESVEAYKNLKAIIFAKGFIKQAFINIGKNLEVVVDDIQQFFFLDDDWIMKGAYIGDIVKIYVTGEPNEK